MKWINCFIISDFPSKNKYQKRNAPISRLWNANFGVPSLHKWNQNGYVYFSEFHKTEWNGVSKTERFVQHSENESKIVVCVNFSDSENWVNAVIVDYSVTLRPIHIVKVGALLFRNGDGKWKKGMIYLAGLRKPQCV